MRVDINKAIFLSDKNTLHLYDDNKLEIYLYDNGELIDSTDGFYQTIITDGIRGNTLTQAYNVDHDLSDIASGKITIDIPLDKVELVNFLGEHVSKKAYITIWLSNIDQDKHNLLLDDVIKIYNVYGDNI